MKYLKTFEEVTGVEFVAPRKPHGSYKNEVKKKKKKKKGEASTEPVMVPPNKTRDAVSFQTRG